MSHMLQAVMTSPGNIEFRDVPVPKPGRGEVLIRMMRIGVCGSDIHVWHGKHPFTKYPVVQGHEVSGELAGIGEGVQGFSVGDAVTIMPQVFCGRCYPCTHGDYHICDELKVMGFQTLGAASEYFVAEASKVIALPRGMSFDDGAMIEPLAVAVHALEKGGGAKGKKVLVIGAGPIGNLVAQAAKAMGAQAVMAADISPFRLGIARDCGVNFCVNSSAEDLADAVARDFGPDKADLILDCAGAPQTISKAVEIARKGSCIVVVAVFGSKPVVDIGLVQDRELRIVGTLMYKREDYVTAIELAGAGKVQLSKLVTDSFPFRQYADAYAFIDRRGDKAMKVIVRVQE